MTAEIAVLNKNGIALAADSKVTIGSTGQEKTYDTVNKLFTLSKIHPIAIMVYGNAEFMRYPWETIVKLYRQSKGAQDEPTVGAWALDFVGSLGGFGNIRPSDKVINLTLVIGSVFESVQDKAFAEARRKGIPVPSADYVSLLTTKVQQQIIRAERLKDFFDEAQQTAFRENHAATLTDVANSYFQAFGDAELLEKAKALAWLSAVKCTYSPQSSGIVIAGFGREEYFPALVSYETDGYIGDVLKITADHEAEITRDMPATIVPFAQSDMVMRFMNGIDPNLSVIIPRLLHPTMIKNCLDVLEKYGDPSLKTDETRAQIRAAVSAAVAELEEPFSKIQQAQFSEPIMQMVSLLPKDELPNLAESLVALTSLKRHVSRDAETVGGPVDVALISKGDGFVWIKRKHYFKPELNPQFSRNYLRGIVEPTGEDDEGSSARSLAGATRKRTPTAGRAPGTAAE